MLLKKTEINRGKEESKGNRKETEKQEIEWEELRKS